MREEVYTVNVWVCARYVVHVSSVVTEATGGRVLVGYIIDDPRVMLLVIHEGAIGSAHGP